MRYLRKCGKGRNDLEEVERKRERFDRLLQIVEDEITRIKNDPTLCHLIKDEEE